MPIPKSSLFLNSYHILIDGLFDATPILLSFIIIGFGADEKAVGSILSLAFIVTTLAGLATIYLSQRWGFLRTICIVTTCLGVGYTANAFSPNLYTTGLFCIIALAGHGLFHNIAFSYLTSHNDRAVLGKAMSNFTVLGDMGRIPFVSLAGYAGAISLWGFAGWRSVCLLYGLLALAASVYVLYLNTNKTTPLFPQDPTRSSTPRRFPSFALLHDPQVRLALSASGLDAFSSDRLFAFLPFLLLAKGIEPTVIGTFALGFTVGSLAGKFVCGRMTDIFGNRRVFIVSELLMAVLVVVLLFSQQLWCIISAAMLLGAVTRGTVPIIQTIITEPVKNATNFDDIFALNSLLRGSINTASPAIFGFLAAAMGIEFVYGLMSAVATLAVLPIFFLRTDKTTP
ncbi:MAG: MFS transporter [Desulfovibrionaceae bacterium]